MRTRESCSLDSSLIGRALLVEVAADKFDMEVCKNRRNLFANSFVLAMSFSHGPSSLCYSIMISRSMSFLVNYIPV